jgi:tRNA(fMet)-specific endonuclease VapC
LRGVLIDTNVISYIFKGDARAVAYQSLLDQTPMYVSFQSIAELEVWTRRDGWGKARLERFRNYLSAFEFVPHSSEISACWVQAKLETLERGRPMSGEDLWIAATALALEILLVTHNAADFAGLPELEVLTA